MKICLLTNQELHKNPLPANDWPCDPRPFYKNADWHVETLEKKTSIEQIKKLANIGFDLYFNLCDGVQDEVDNPGIEVVKTLEELNLPFTGADSNFFEPPREKMKHICRQEKIQTPSYVFVRQEDDISKVLSKLTFPMIVKHYSSYASIGLSPRSRVQTKKGLASQIKKICTKYSCALVEEYIEGIECTVLVGEGEKAKPMTYRPIQYQFPPGESFKHEAIKWKDFNSVDAFPVKNKTLDRKLRSDALRFYKAIDGVSYGRCDFRVDEQGTPFLLEINPNCGLFYPDSAAASADLCLLAERNGHETFTRRVIKSALFRHKKRKQLNEK